MKRFVVGLFFSALTFGQTPMLTLTAPSLLARLGGTVTVNLSVANTPVNLAALQWTVGLPTGFTKTAVAGQATTTAAKTLYCDETSPICLAVGVNTNVYGPGVVATYTVHVPATASLGPLTIPLSGLVGASLPGDEVVLSAGPPLVVEVYNPFDVDGNGVVDVRDAQAVINAARQISGVTPPKADVNGDGRVNVADAQAVANAIPRQP